MSPFSGRRRAGGAGFTLVELLIALALIATITVLMFSALRLGGRAWDSVETVSEQFAELRLTRNFMERMLRQARATRLTWNAQALLAFAGDTQRLEFVAPLSEHVGLPGLYVLRFELEDAGDDQRLIMTRWLLHPEILNGDGGTPAWEPLGQDSAAGQSATDGLDRDLAIGAQGRTLLLPRVARFALSYYGIANGEQEPDWHEEWIDQQRLPRYVRLELSTPEQSWPATLVALPDGGDALVRR